MTTDVFEAVDVPVPGGELRVGIRDPGSPAADSVLLLHGVTASHRAWDQVAARLPGVRLIAPDLRGRGRSNQVVGGTGMARHADDLAAVLEHLGVRRTTVVGHSMGGFVAVVLAHRHPGLVSRLVLVDGGLPLDVPEGLTSDQVVQHVLGPAAERLAMDFPDLEAYLDFWRQHPAFQDAWTAQVEGYFGYDLVGEAPSLRPATSYDAMAADTVDLHTGTALPEALGALRHPTRLLTVPRGLFDETPGLYAPSRVQGLLAEYPGVEHEELPGLNHYTVVMSPAGADVVAERILADLGREAARAD